MSIVGELLARHQNRLSGFPGPLTQHFETGLRELAPRLSASQLQSWAETGIELTSLNLRSWEAAAEYFRAGAASRPTRPGSRSNILAARQSRCPRNPLRSRWHCSVRLPKRCRPWETTTFASGPTSGRRLYKGNWKSSALAAQFYDLSPQVFGVLRVSQASRLVLFVEELSRHSYELAAACLSSSPEVLAKLEDDDRLPFLTYAVELAQSSWADSRLYFERGVPLLHKVHQPVRERYLLLAAQVAKGHQRSAFQYLEESALALGQLDPDDHQKIVELGEQLAPYSPYAAMDFLTNIPQVLNVVHLEEMEPWHAAGLQILRASRDGGEAYFRLQSTRGEDVLENLSARVELSRIGEIMRLYCKALTGKNVSVQASAALAEKGIGWTDEQRATTEGTTIFLPEVMEKYRLKDENFAAFKVFATHQAGRLEFGSFDFHYERPGVLFDTHRAPLAEGVETTTDMERFFDFFPNRKLASDLFTIAEDSRIDAAVKTEYGGIRRPLYRMQEEELERRPSVRTMPMRDGLRREPRAL